MLQVCINIIIALCSIVLVQSAYALPQKTPSPFIVEGQDYTKLPDDIRQNKTVEQLLRTDPNKVQVLFFFSYGCHGCDLFHKPFAKWAAEQNAKSSQKVVIYTYPVSFNTQWGMLARLYYVEQMLEPSGKLADKIFNAVQKQSLKLWDVDIMRKFFEQQGFTAEQFDQAYNSFIIKRQIAKAESVIKAYNVSATPDIIVNGPVNSYKVDIAKAGTNMQRILDVLNYIVAREAKLF